MIETAEAKLSNKLPQLRKTLLDYAKRRDISKSGRKYFYIAVEELETKFPDLNGEIEETAEINGQVNGGHERDENDEIINHVMIEEGYDAHSPLKDIVANGGSHAIDYMDDEFDEEDFVDPYENLSEEEMMARLPPYFNKSHKQKKKFFKKLNQKYVSSLRMPKNNNGNADGLKVNFDLKKNMIKKFKKQQKVRD